VYKVLVNAHIKRQTCSVYIYGFSWLGSTVKVMCADLEKFWQILHVHFDLASMLRPMPIKTGEIF